jgi:hypothetical protein
VACAYHTSYIESVNRMIVVQVEAGINAKPYPKITKARRTRGCDSSGSMLV